MPRREKIKKDIIDQLSWDGRVDAADIQVEVLDKGRVRLSGTVPTYMALLAAAEDVRAVAGVTDVQNDIIVKYQPERVRFDEDITNDILDILGFDPDIDILNIDVTVRNGMVTLQGNVDNYWKKIKAEELVGNVRGVTELIDKLAIVPTETYADTRIADDVVAALDRNISVDVKTINVKVENGVVTLSGTVPSWTARYAARDTARYTAGVKDVRDELAIGIPAA